MLHTPNFSFRPKAQLSFVTAGELELELEPGLKPCQPSHSYMVEAKRPMADICYVLL